MVALTNATNCCEQCGAAGDWRVLVVDDDRLLASAYMKILQLRGFTVNSVGSLDEALRFLEADPDRIIVSDIMMDGGSGLDLLKRVTETYPDLPMIMITGDPNVAPAADAVRLGAYDYLLKPVEGRVLVQAVQRACELLTLRRFKRIADKQKLEHQMNLEMLVAERTRELADLATAVDQSADSIVITDAAGVIRYVNPAFESVSGYLKQEVVGKTPAVIKSGQHDAQFYRSMWQRLKSGKVWKGQLINRKKDGSIFREEASISPIRGEQGRISSFVAIKRDITERQRLESIAEAANLMDNLGYIFAGIRHEIGNPINSIKMSLAVLKKNMATYPRETILEFLERALAEVSRVEYLLKAFKSFSMYESPEIQKVDLKDFMAKFLTLASQDFHHRGIRLNLKYKGDRFVALADPRMLHQIMLNLMTNAADALLDRPEPRIAIEVRTLHQRVQILVRDNGCGMSPKELSRVFQPFFTTKASGTGLGLVIVRKMLLKMKADVRVGSEKDRGTLISVTLPEATHDVSYPETHGSDHRR